MTLSYYFRNVNARSVRAENAGEEEKEQVEGEGTDL